VTAIVSNQKQKVDEPKIHKSIFYSFHFGVGLILILKTENLSTEFAFLVFSYNRGVFISSLKN